MSEGDNDVLLPLRISMHIVYKRQIIIKSVQFIGLIYIVYGIFVAFTRVCINLDKKAFETGQFMYFWDPVAAIYSMANFIVFAMTISYKYWNYQRRHGPLFAMPADHMIVCFILIPLFFFSAVDSAMEILKDIIIIPCNGRLTCLMSISTFLLFIGVAIMIFDVGQRIPTAINWKMKLMRTCIVFFTVIGISNSFIISFSYQHMMIFKEESQKDAYNDTFIFNDTCVDDSHIRSSMSKAYHLCDKYLRSAVLLFCVCSFAYFIQSLLEKDNDSDTVDQQPLLDNERVVNLSTSQILNRQSIDMALSRSSTQSVNADLEIEPIAPVVNAPNKTTPDLQTPSFRLPSAALVLCIIFLSTSFLSFIIVLSLRSNENNLKMIGSIISTTFPIFIYILGSVLSVVHVYEVGTWPSLMEKDGKIIEKCLIWIGAAGQLAVSMATIAVAIELLKNPQNKEIMYTSRNFLLIPKNLLIIVQTYLQTILISLAIDRKWVRPKVESWAEFLCPAVGMMGLNIGMLLLNISEMNFPIIDEPIHFLFLDLLLKGVKSIGGTLSSLQRLHASILFASMIIYTHN